MNESAPGLYNLPHAVFLRRLAGATRGSSLDARLGRAGFVALRLIDLLAPDASRPSPDAFHYQHTATERACRGLPADRPETAHLIGVVQSTADAYHTHDVGLLFPALFAYAHYLEDEMYLEEALDVLETMLRVGRGQIRPDDAIAVQLRMGRVHRKLNRFAEAEAAYGTAEGLAHSAGDGPSVLLGRVGRAIALQGRGNLGEAERELREIAAQAEQLGNEGIHAGVLHALGTTLLLRGQVADAIVHVWRAVGLYDDETSRVRALGDLGTMLLAVGEPAGAKSALLQVLKRSNATSDTMSNAMIELMHCASFQRDQVGFERWRGECKARMRSMPPNILGDFYLKAAIGHARFENVPQAESAIEKALRIAESNGLHELVFRIERIRAGLNDCRLDVDVGIDAVARPVHWSEPVRDIALSLVQVAD
jgi:tetratricopeptide (TPR) repeat protein